MVTNMYYKECEVMIGEVKTWVNLVKLGKMEYDVILGIDWLSTQCAHVDCHQKEKKIEDIAMVNEYLNCVSRRVTRLTSERGD